MPFISTVSRPMLSTSTRPIGWPFSIVPWKLSASTRARAASLALALRKPTSPGSNSDSSSASSSLARLCCNEA